MIGGLFRLVVLVAIVGAVGAFLLGYRVHSTDGGYVIQREPPVAGTSGTFDPGKARDGAARLGEKAANTANEAAKALDDGALTAKIKAKMALDDHVKAMDIDVDTKEGIVTLSGKVDSKDARDRAIRLASETLGVRSVKDQLVVR
jgi:BON domain-containing protein